MSRIVLIGCGKQKAAKACRAADLYTGPLCAARVAYAEATGEDFWIVSALHGLVTPDTLLEPYELELKDVEPVNRAAWALDVIHRLLDELDDATHLREVNVELHMGADYAEVLRDVAQAVGLSACWPVQGLGIGEQRAYYKDAIGYAKRGLIVPPPARGCRRPCSTCEGRCSLVERHDGQHMCKDAVRGHPGAVEVVA